MFYFSKLLKFGVSSLSSINDFWVFEVDYDYRSYMLMNWANIVINLNICEIDFLYTLLTKLLVGWCDKLASSSKVIPLHPNTTLIPSQSSIS